jgi:hypothetical protein
MGGSKNFKSKEKKIKIKKKSFSLHSSSLIPFYLQPQ